MNNYKHPLRINVGFIIRQSSGYQKVFNFDYPELSITDGLDAQDFVGNATISRAQGGLVVEAEFKATLPTECGRCLKAIEQEVITDFTELFAFDERTSTESELIIPENKVIDLAPLVRDFLIVSAPINPLCKPECPGLCPLCGIDRNKNTCECEIESIDPRLAALKDLLDTND